MSETRRILERFLKKGLAGLQPRDALALLLRRASHEPEALADRLITRFRSVADVLNADPAELRKIDEKGAEQIALAREIWELKSSVAIYRNGLFEPGAPEKYFSDLIKNSPVEQLRAAVLSDRGTAVACRAFVSESGVGVPVSPEAVIDLARRHGCRLVMIAHNHPSGSCEPSPEDLAATRALAARLAQSGVTLLQHVVVSREGAMGIMGSKAE